MQNVDDNPIGIENTQDIGATATDWVSDFNSLKISQEGRHIKKCLRNVPTTETFPFS